MAKKNAGSVQAAVNSTATPPPVVSPPEPPGKKSLPSRRAVIARLIVEVAAAVALGVAAAWPIADGEGALRAAVYSISLFAALALFGVVLPRFLTLPMQIFVAMIAGVAVGWLLDFAGYETFVVDYLGIFGTFFIILLKMVVIPLVFTSIVAGLATISDVGRIGRLGIKTFVYYSVAAMVATLVGLFVVNLIQPGAGRSHLREQGQAAATATADEAPDSLGQRIQNEFLPRVIPSVNVARVPILAIIFAAIVLGLALAVNGEKTAPATDVFCALNDAIMTVVDWIMRVAPIGVFALMAGVIATLGMGYLQTLGLYVFTVVLGLTLHFCILVFLVVQFLGRYSPRRFLRAMSPALQLGFSTSSSSATLPVSLDCITERVGVSRNVAGFMLPIGATVNMNGTALYQAVAVLFIAQVYGRHLGLGEQFLVFLTAILVSIGTAGIPGASVGLMVMVLGSVGLPAEGIGLILGVDRFLDMCRTVVNVLDDSVCATVVARTENELSPPAELA